MDTPMIELNEYNFEKDVLARKGVSVVRFWATWCGPCTAIKPTYDDVARTLEEKALFGEVDIDKAPELSSTMGIRSVPTVVVLKDGQAVGGLVGLASKSRLIELIEAHL